MLGKYVSSYFQNKNFDVINFSRKHLDISKDDLNGLESLLVYYKISRDDVIINCAGTIKPRVDELGEKNAIMVNSIFPRNLSEVVNKFNSKLIHVTTDCVFSGKTGLYDENSTHDVHDVYGRTKSLGEPSDCTVIRTSIIGEELGQSRSLLEWVKSRKGMDANGFTNHNWNGVTCLQLAKVIKNIVVNSSYWEGVRHIFSPEPVTKEELLHIINDAYNLNISINPTTAAEKCYRTLSTIYDDEPHKLFGIPTIEEQISELSNHILT